MDIVGMRDGQAGAGERGSQLRGIDSLQIDYNHPYSLPELDGHWLALIVNIAVCLFCPKDVDYHHGRLACKSVRQHTHLGSSHETNGDRG